MASVLTRIAKSLGWTSSPGPLTAPAHATWEGWIPSTWPINFGQIGFDPVRGGMNSVVYSCIMLYARTISQLPGDHLRKMADGAYEPVTNSALSRILKKPNVYQTNVDFLLNMIIGLLEDGNGIAVAFRNDRYEVAELHQLPWRSCQPIIAADGDIFYSIGGNPAIDYWQDSAWENGGRWVVPARDILHLRGPASPDRPLIGESPLIAAGLPIAMNTGGAAYFQQFYNNMSRPSGVLHTDTILTTAQVGELRNRWEEHSKGAALGGTPILTAGLKWQQTSFTATDAQIAESMKLSVADIARLFGVPLALIDDMTGATQTNVENLVMMWLRQGLGYYIRQIERGYDKLFNIELSNTDETNFDVDFLLRPDFKTRIEGYVRAVQGGVYSPNEARAKEGLGRATAGDEPRVQQQVVPLSAWDMVQQPATPAAPAATPAPADDDKMSLGDIIKAITPDKEAA
jgi:HK97 family phage portal protein